MNMLVRSVFWMLLVLLGIPAWAQTIAEREPNDTRGQAMTLQPGVTVAGTFSRPHASSLRRGEDVDHYRITGLASPGSYTVTITPGNPACRYVADVAHTPLVIQGTTTVVFELTGQGTTRVTRRYGNLAEERATLPNEPRELAVLLYNPSFQCVTGGPYYDEIPYRISVASGSAPVAGVPQTTAAATAGQAVQEREPNDTKGQAMALQPEVTVLGTFSRPHASSLRRGEDVDNYHVTGLVAPGTYTVTITPGNPACRYVADVAHTPLVIQGTTTVVFELTGQNSTRVTRRYGNRPEERVTIFSGLRELDILLYNPSFQCVTGGPYYDEIPYRLAITAGSAAVATSAASSPLPSASPPPSASLPPPKPPLQGARIYDITAAREVAWGQPVGPGNVFAPDVNPIYVWFRHQGLQSGATITAVWYFLSTVTPTRIGDGAVTVTPPSDWGQFNFELAAGKRWPAGDYRVELQVAGQAVGEARFRVATNAP